MKILKAIGITVGAVIFVSIIAFMLYGWALSSAWQ